MRVASPVKPGTRGTHATPPAGLSDNPVHDVLLAFVAAHCDSPDVVNTLKLHFEAEAAGFRDSQRQVHYLQDRLHRESRGLTLYGEWTPTLGTPMTEDEAVLTLNVFDCTKFFWDRQVVFDTAVATMQAHVAAIEKKLSGATKHLAKHAGADVKTMMDICYRLPGANAIIVEVKQKVKRAIAVITACEALNDGGDGKVAKKVYRAVLNDPSSNFVAAKQSVLKDLHRTQQVSSANNQSRGYRGKSKTGKKAAKKVGKV